MRRFHRLSRYFFVALVATFIVLSNDSSAQVTFVIRSIPADTPPGDSIFISGSFNNWVVKDPAMQLMPQPDGSLSLTLRKPPKYFEYKFTRGSWAQVEGDKSGNTIANRIFTQGSPSTIEVNIESWMDFQSVTIIVNRLPHHTPAEAPIYMTGPFNHWNPADPNYKFERLENGTYQYILLHRDSLTFKFTRGTLEAIEADAAGNPIATRKLALSKSDARTLIYQINGWEDFSETRAYSIRDILLIGLIMALFCITGLFTLRNGKRENNLLAVMLGLIAVAIATRILLQQQYFYYKIPKLILFPLLLVFALAPLLNFYAKNLVHHYQKLGMREYLIIQIPLAILIVGLLPMLISENSYLVTSLLNGDLKVNFKVVAAIGVVYNTFYLFETFKVLNRSRITGGFGTLQWTYHHYLMVLLVLSAFLTLVLTATLLASFGFFANDGFAEQAIDLGIALLWIGLCLYPIVVAWFLIARPEIFSLNAEIEKSKSRDALGALKAKLDEMMEIKKPFLNPDLSLHDLASMLQTNTHTLSRLINEGDVSNFHDFINQYRITEFKKRVENGQHKAKTIIAIANDVGFKSKTTFNRTFKKLNGSTPRDYLNRLKIEY